MAETVEVWFNGVAKKCEAHVICTEKGCNIEFVDAPIVVDYQKGKQDD